MSFGYLYGTAESGPSELVAGRLSVVLPTATCTDRPLSVTDPSSGLSVRLLVRPDLISCLFE